MSYRPYTVYAVSTPDALAADLLRVPDTRFVAGQSLADVTSLRIGGRPWFTVECVTAPAVAGVVRELDSRGVESLVLGGGSNLVAAEGDLDFVVVAVRNADVEFDGGVVRAGAGVNWDELVASTVDAGFGGLECLSGIPGSVGATPVQNVGAYGVEVSGLLRRVRLYDRRAGTDEWVEPEALQLGYRTSVLKNTTRAVVLEVEFDLRVDGLSEPVRYAELARALGVEQGERASAAAVREAVLGLRRGKGMVLDAVDHDTWSAGSFFTNPIVGADEVETIRERVAAHTGEPEVAASMPAFESAGGVKLSAGWLIERAGFVRGYPGPHAPARLSTKHTLALTNRGRASADDIVALARTVRDGVWEAFGVDLRPEPVWVGCEI